MIPRREAATPKLLLLALFCFLRAQCGDFDSKISRPRFCLEECTQFHATYLLFLSRQTSKENFLKAKFLLLSQIEDCFEQRSSFHLRVVLGDRADFTCCSYLSCTEKVMQLGAEDALLDGVPETQIDDADRHGMYESVVRAVTGRRRNRTHNMYLIADFAVPKFSENAEFVRNITQDEPLYPLIITTNNLSIENIEKYLGVLNPVEVVDFDQFFNSGVLVKGVCYRDFHSFIAIHSVCNVSGSSEIPTEIPDEVATDLRVFMAFNFSDPLSEFEEIRDVFTRMLNETESHFGTQLGNVIVSGPRFSVIATCTLRQTAKCAKSIQEASFQTVAVNSGAIIENDLDFAPDVMNYMRYQALRPQRNNRKALVVILSDFISKELAKNKFFFQKATDSQDVFVTVAMVLPPNSNLTTEAVAAHYRGISQRVFTFRSFQDLSQNSEVVFNYSIGSRTTLPYVTSHTVTAPLPTSTVAECNHSLPITTEISRKSRDNDTVILILLRDFLTPADREKIRMQLLEEIKFCVLDNHQFRIVNAASVQKSKWCHSVDCVDDSLRTMVLEDSSTESTRNLLKNENATVESIRFALGLMNPDIHKDAWNVPSLFVLTNFVSHRFLQAYDTDIQFRRDLSQVRFRMIVIHAPIEAIKRYSSVPASDLISVRNVSLWNYDVLDCCYKEIVRHHSVSVLSAPIKGVIITGSILILAMLLGIAYWIRRSKLISRRNKLLSFPENTKNWFRKNSALLSDTESILSVEPMFEEMKRDLWEMDRSKLIVFQDQQIGHGAFGVVYKGRLVGKAPIEDIHRKSLFAQQFENCEVAVKRLPEHLENSQRERFLEEIETMKDIGFHQNLGTMLGCITDTSPLCFVMQYAEYGDLFNFVRKRKLMLNTDSAECHAHDDGQVCIRELISFSWQIADGMAFLHARGFIHRDLAARNILVRKGRQVMISDFGLCRRKKANDVPRLQRRKSKIPVRWTAPEALSDGRFNEHSDVWSYGVLMFEMFSMGKTPYGNLGIQVVNSHIQSGNRLQRPVFAPNDIWDLMRSCWESMPTKRPDFCEIRRRLENILEALTNDYYLDLSNETKRKSFRIERDLPLLITATEEFGNYLSPPKQ